MEEKIVEFIDGIYLKNIDCFYLNILICCFYKYWSRKINENKSSFISDSDLNDLFLSLPFIFFDISLFSFNQQKNSPFCPPEIIQNPYMAYPNKTVYSASSHYYSWYFFPVFLVKSLKKLLLARFQTFISLLKFIYLWSLSWVLQFPFYKQLYPELWTSSLLSLSANRTVQRSSSFQAFVGYGIWAYYATQSNDFFFLGCPRFFYNIGQ